MTLLRGLFQLVSQFIPLLLTFALAGASYWFALQSEIDLFGRGVERDPTVRESFLVDFTIQTHQIEQGDYSIIRSASAEQIPQGNLWNIDSPDMEQHRADGQMINGQAEKGVYEVELDTLTLSDSAMVETTREGIKTRLESQQLIIDNAQSQVRTDTAVTVTRPKQRFVAEQGAVYNQSNGELSAEGPVRVTLEARTR